MSATGRGRPREADDYYTTPSWAVRRLLEAWRPAAGSIVEPSAGNGAMIRAAEECGIDRSRWHAYEVREEERDTLAALCTVDIGDFLTIDRGASEAVHAVIGNPPYSKAFEFVQTAQRRFPRAEVCFLLRLAFAASADRNDFMRSWTPDVYVLPDRPSFTGDGSDSADYAFFVWPNEARPGRFHVLNTTPLAERKRDPGHAVMIETPQRELFG